MIYAPTRNDFFRYSRMSSLCAHVRVDHGICEAIIKKQDFDNKEKVCDKGKYLE